MPMGPPPNKNRGSFTAYRVQVEEPEQVGGLESLLTRCSRLPRVLSTVPRRSSTDPLRGMNTTSCCILGPGDEAGMQVRGT